MATLNNLYCAAEMCDDSLVSMGWILRVGKCFVHAKSGSGQLPNFPTGGAKGAGLEGFPLPIHILTARLSVAIT